MLRTIITGQPSEKPPLLIAHGLFGSARNWGVISKRLSDTRQVIAVDMRNHGESGWFDTHSYADMANDLAEIIASFGGPVDVLGHSMGGKCAMVLATEHAGKLNRLIVADIAPVAYTHTQIHLANAMQSLDPSAVSNRGEADQLLSDSIAEPSVRAFLLQSLDIKGSRWKLNLDVLTAEMPAILGFPKLGGQFNGPTLFLSGGESDYVKPEHRPEIKRLFPTARFAKIPGAGHWIHAEKPREFEAAVRAFLDA
ncbi:MAG: alpha/beta fold hydrolase [Marinosulfonomonas sp.]|nr:alpha/beta fold hydrolase [Marinosulfonomonas sp.]